MVKIFITGATGYIGGDFLFLATKTHPEWEITCLVRNSDKAARLSSKYPRVRVVLGELDSLSTIESEVSRCDIVYHFANSDHLKSAQAIARGLAANRNSRAFWIHTSGAGILTYENFAKQSFGYALPSDKKIYDDWDNIKDLIALPDRAIHRHVDKVVLSASESGQVRTAIVAPSCIWGDGRGVGNTSSIQVHIAARVSLAAGRGLQVGDGSSIWHEVHIHDLSRLYLLLGEAAAAGGDPASWNDQGYYLAENGSFTWGQVAQRVAEEGNKQGLMGSTDVESVDFEKSKSHHPLFPYLCGTTSRGVSERAQRLLGWQPVASPMLEAIPYIVQQEASKLGLRASKKRTSAL